MAADNTIAPSTVYAYLHEGINALAARAPDLEQALLQAKEAGLSHLNLDGTVVRTDRVSPRTQRSRSLVVGPDSCHFSVAEPDTAR